MSADELRQFLHGCGWSMLKMRRALVRQWGEAGWYERWPAFSLVLSEVLRGR